MKRKIYLLITLLIFLSITLITSADEGKDKINLTHEEIAFIEAHPLIRLGVDPKFVPFEFIDEDGQYKGIAKDYLDIISQKTGLQFQIQENLTWPEAYELAIQGELDGLPAVGRTQEREKYFHLSEPYYYFKRVIATKDTNTRISGMEDLEGTTVAVQRNSSHHSYLLDHKKINLSLYDSVESALTAVATGEEIAFVGNLATTDYLIRTNAFTNLRFISFEAEKEQALYFAGRKDWPELVSIFNKGANAITDSEKNEIGAKWIALDTQLDYGPIIKKIKAATAFFLIVFSVSIFWVMKLQKEIKRRKIIQTKLEEANEKTDKANEALQTANSELRKISMLDGLTGISNRRYFDSFLQKLWDINMREKFPIALIMIDIDNFKNFNDKYGHLAGDQCLKDVALVINEAVRSAGDFVARFGGEEFAVLISNTIEEDAASLAERIRLKVEEMVINVDGLDSKITISLGVASMITTKGSSPADLIHAADCALYEAKRSGKNKVVQAHMVLNDCTRQQPIP